jgi:transposase
MQTITTIDARASSHHWLRELPSLGLSARPLPPAYVKLGRKNDATGAEAICEGVMGPNMRSAAT